MTWLFLLRSERSLWSSEKLFLSAASGLHAKRLFCFGASGSAFPHDEFLGSLQPWLQMQIAESEGMEVPREGIGCWHPVFPARVDDLWLPGAAAAKWIEGQILDPGAGPRMVVFEQTQDDGGVADTEQLRAAGRASVPLPRGSLPVQFAPALRRRWM
ncbi:MAG: hypothetical protein ACN0LA_12055 [Candidatus Longimicrobiales bacterium M2_2A_002]